jgi:hypothetical protein
VEIAKLQENLEVFVLPVGNINIILRKSVQIVTELVLVIIKFLTTYMVIEFRHSGQSIKSSQLATGNSYYTHIAFNNCQIIKYLLDKIQICHY